MTAYRVVNHLVFGYLREHQLITYMYADAEIANIVLEYIDATSIEYYRLPIKINLLTQVHAFLCQIHCQIIHH